jgi:hypothetical protein
MGGERGGPLLRCLLTDGGREWEKSKIADDREDDSVCPRPVRCGSGGKVTIMNQAAFALWEKNVVGGWERGENRLGPRDRWTTERVYETQADRYFSRVQPYHLHLYMYNRSTDI